MSNFPVTHVVVHYSATFPSQDITAADVDKWHRARGFAGIGYHYFIRRDGTVEKGRAEHAIGAHVGGQNKGKIGICWAGGLAADGKTGERNWTPAQEAAVIATIRDVLSRHPTAKVVGHRDLAATQCPGFDVIPWWASLNAKPAAQRLGPGEYVVEAGRLATFDTNGRLIVK